MKIIIALFLLACAVFLKGILQIAFLGIDSPYEELLVLKIITLCALCILAILGFVWHKKKQKHTFESKKKY